MWWIHDPIFTELDSRNSSRNVRAERTEMVSGRRELSWLEWEERVPWFTKCTE